ncbi:MAG: hypothetical protein CME32_23275 [Gimesia sp.]|nr:hypothetical protein [Gimesia sp.]
MMAAVQADSGLRSERYLMQDTEENSTTVLQLTSVFGILGLSIYLALLRFGFLIWTSFDVIKPGIQGVSFQATRS